jgi:hypothetical protein
MKYRRELLLLIPTIASIFFITDYNVFFGSNVQAQGQSQSTNSVCNGDSCFTTVCSNNQPCKTFSSNQPSIVQPAEEATTMQPAEEIPNMQTFDETTVIQPAEEIPNMQTFDETTVIQPAEEIPNMQTFDETTVIQPAEETIVMQPVEYIESTLEVCDDGLDNDNDGKVDNKDEECEATTLSSASPIQGQLMPDDQNEPEEDKPQSELPSQEEEHTDNDSSNYDEEKEDKDEENN